ncbi:uncharacterized protein F5147DRAFT_574696, partial [Suillus discolor]
FYGRIFLASLVFCPSIPPVPTCIIMLHVMLILLPPLARQKARKNEDRFYS